MAKPRRTYVAYTKKERTIKSKLKQIVHSSTYGQKEINRVSRLNKQLNKIRSERAQKKAKAQGR
jgi:hypothetical protein